MEVTEFKEGEQYRVVGEPKRHWRGSATRLIDSLTPPVDAIVTVTDSGLDSDGDVRVLWIEGDEESEGYVRPENLRKPGWPEPAQGAIIPRRLEALQTAINLSAVSDVGFDVLGAAYFLLAEER